MSSETPTQDQYTPTQEQTKPPVDTSGSIPFTGFEAGFALVVAVTLIALGAMMRKLAKATR